MMNMAHLMKQAQQMQKKFKETQDELANEEYWSETANGAIKACCDGQGKFKAIKLSKEAINPENPENVDDDTVEMLEDLITTALSNATKDAIAQMESKMKSITGGINIPGLF